MRTSKERYRAVEVANPNLGGAGVEIENAFFVDLRSGIRKAVIISIQIVSGERLRTAGSCVISDRLDASQATSTALTPAAVETGHSGKALPSGRSVFRRPIRWPWRRECWKAGGGLMRMWPC